jgi:hypothetical protein
MLNDFEWASVNMAIVIINKIKEIIIEIIGPIVLLLIILFSDLINKKPAFDANPIPNPKIEVVWNIVK